MDEEPESHASARIAQYMAVAVQVAEATVRLRQQRADQRAQADSQAAAAARAEVQAQRAADRMVWGQALNRSWVRSADLADLGRAWGSASGWAEVDPLANTAATRVETRLAQMAPVSMSRYDALRSQEGLTREAAMRAVLADLAAESMYRAAERRVWAADAAADVGGLAHDDGRAAAQRSTSAGQEDAQPIPGGDADWRLAQAGEPATAAQIGWAARLLEKHPDLADEVDLATMTRGEISVLIEQMGGGPRIYRVTDSGQLHPADLAADSYPRPYTQVKPAAAATASAPGAAEPAVRRAQTRALTR
jgi:hypothetical protein